MVNRKKHFWNLEDNIFSIFIDDSEGGMVGQNLYYWDAKTQNCLLTHQEKSNSTGHFEKPPGERQQALSKYGEHIH